MGGILLAKGQEIDGQVELLMAQRAANRRSLRDLGEQGLLTPEESVEVDERYPARAKLTIEERAAAASATADALKTKAAAAATAKAAGAKAAAKARA